MAPGNVENLRAFLEALDLEAWRRGEGGMSLLDPNVIYEDTTLPDHVGETYRGPEGVARATERWLEPYEQLTIELEQVVGAGDRLGCGRAQREVIEVRRLLSQCGTRPGDVLPVL